jgi:hypothetical protein
MNPLICGCGVAAGTLLLSRPLDLFSRTFGAGLITVSLLSFAAPALAAAWGFGDLWGSFCVKPCFLGCPLFSTAAIRLRWA